MVRRIQKSPLLIRSLDRDARIQHEPLARAAGLSGSQLLSIRDVSNVSGSSSDTSEVLDRPGEGLSTLQAAALRYTDYMTRSVSVPDDAFKGLRSLLRNDQQMLEATATIASYNMVSRILVALDIGDKAQTEVPFPSAS